MNSINSAGFRGFALSLVGCQPSTADSITGTALDDGATTRKPVKKLALYSHRAAASVLGRVVVLFE
ncbi:hypothetical protein Vqi01_58280 [Micromonospora qiuiae]|uniref:Uncharacterized protein n=2 Tax=Micromonospora qiuiae TaxID=502268 RepID=A0ABQ4JJP9_9ACTN|nr:hypothetical protein Vqi01_58280 [Micromonospora qiuiae]